MIGYLRKYYLFRGKLIGLRRSYQDWVLQSYNFYGLNSQSPLEKEK